MKIVKVKRLLVLPKSGYEHFYDVKANVNNLQGCFDEPPVELHYQDYVKLFQGLSLLRLGVVFYL